MNPVQWKFNGECPGSFKLSVKAGPSQATTLIYIILLMDGVDLRPIP